MKTFITIISIIILLIGTVNIVKAEDVSLTITIPSKAVPRIVETFRANGCKGPIKECIKAEVIKFIKYRVRTYEINKARNEIKDKDDFIVQ